MNHSRKPKNECQRQSLSPLVSRRCFVFHSVFPCVSFFFSFFPCLFFARLTGRHKSLGGLGKIKKKKKKKKKKKITLHIPWRVLDHNTKTTHNIMNKSSPCGIDFPLSREGVSLGTALRLFSSLSLTLFLFFSFFCFLNFSNRFFFFFFYSPVFAFLVAVLFFG